MKKPVLVTEPTDAVISIAEAIEWARLQESESSTVESLIQAATNEVSAKLWRQLVTATYELSLDGFPCGRKEIRLPLPPLQSVSSISYRDVNGATQTLSASLWEYDARSDPGIVVPKAGQVWPQAEDSLNSVTIRFVCGYGGASDVPAELRLEVARCVEHHYRNRGGEMPYRLTSAAMAHRAFEYQ